MTASGTARLEENAVWHRLLARRRGAAAALPTVMSPFGAQLVELYGALCEVRPGEPFLLAHLGQSLDGRIATATGASQWLTGEGDLGHTHRLRAIADAVLVGAATVRHDDPQLTVRRCDGDNPVRVVIDPDRRLGAHHRVFCDEAAPTLLIAAADRAAPGERHGQAEILPLPRTADGIAPGAICAALVQRGLSWLLIEGGGITISHFVRARRLDRLQLTLAPVLLGSGRPSLALPEILHPSQGLRPRVRRVMLGEDMLFDCVFERGDG